MILRDTESRGKHFTYIITMEGVCPSIHNLIDYLYFQNLLGKPCIIRELVSIDCSSTDDDYHNKLFLELSMSSYKIQISVRTFLFSKSFGSHKNL